MRQTLQEQFKKTNTFHIFSVSGFNFVVVVLSFLLIISILRVRESLRTPLLIVFALFYLFIVGAQVPSLRAFVMLVLLLLSKKVYRDYRVLNALGVTAILFAAADPLAVLTPSFQLSFSAVLGLATLGKWLSVKMDIFSARSPLDRLNKPAWYAPAWKHVSGVFSGCLAAWAFTTPVLLFHFKEVFLLSSLVNVFITPLVSIVTQMGVYSGFISLFFPFLSMIINMICEKMIFLILVTVDFFYSSLFCMIRGDRMAAWLWTAAAAGFTLYYLLEQQEIRRPQETQDI